MPATPAPELQPPARDGVETGSTGFGMGRPRVVDRPPGVPAGRHVGFLQQTGRLGDAHLTGLVAYQHFAGERAGQLIVKVAPGVNALLGQPVDQLLLRQPQPFVAPLARVAHHEPSRRYVGVGQKGFDGMVVRLVDEQFQRLEQIPEPSLVSLQSALQHKGGFVPAVHREQAGGIRERIRQQLPGLIGHPVNLLGGRHGRVAFELRVELLNPVEKLVQSLEVGLKSPAIGRRVLVAQIPGRSFDDRRGGHQRINMRRDWRAWRSIPAGSSSRGSSSLSGTSTPL